MNEKNPMCFTSGVFKEFEICFQIVWTKGEIIKYMCKTKYDKIVNTKFWNNASVAMLAVADVCYLWVPDLLHRKH